MNRSDTPALSEGNAADRPRPGVVRSLFSLVAPFLGLIVIWLFFFVYGLLDGDPETSLSALLRVGNLKLVALQTTIVAVAALGMTLIIISGGIDLSPGSTIALSTVVVAVTLRAEMSPFVALVTGIGAATIVGLVNGVVITAFRIVPFIVTLGMMGVARGVAKFFAAEQRVTAPVTWLNDVLALPNPRAPVWVLPSGVWILIALSILLYFLLRFTVFGRHVFAIGSSEPTARLCGINVSRSKVLIYTLSGLLTGIAGVLQFSRISVGDPTAAIGLELYIIASVVIGGGSLNGGKGSILGTILGALVMGVLKNGCDLYLIPNYVQETFIGVIIIAAVGVDQVRRR